MDKCHCGKEYVTRTDTIETLVGYFSPAGHDHDDNCKHRTYTCENGHNTSINIRSRCPNKTCSWVGKLTCFCHEGEKVDAWPTVRSDIEVHRY